MKKMVSFLLVLVMVFSCTAALADEQVVTAIMRLPASFVVEDNPVIAAWGERNGVTFDIEAPPISNYADRLNIVMASDEIPDLIFVQNQDSIYEQWCRDELLLDLTPYFTPEKMPHATAVLTAEELASCMVDGKLYSLPRAQAKPYDAIIYRGDWLDKLSLEVPTTPEEFAAVMKAFATQDPDGNGKDDTWGMYLRDGDCIITDRNLVTGFDVLPINVPNADGEYKIWEAQEGYLAMLDWLRGMYADGSIMPEWYMAQAYEDQDMFYAGQIGAIYTDCTVNHLISTANNDTFKAINPDAYLVAGPALHPAGTEISAVYYPPQVWGSYAINAECKDIDKLISILDDGYSNECVTLHFKGIEGMTYTSLDLETRVLEATDEQLKLMNMYASSYLCINYMLEDRSIVIAGGTATTAEDVDKWVQASNAIGAVEQRIGYLTTNAVPGYAAENTKLTNDGMYSELKEYVTRYICGQIDRAELDKFLQNTYLPATENLMKLVADSEINK